MCDIHVRLSETANSYGAPRVGHTQFSCLILIHLILTHEADSIIPIPSGAQQSCHLPKIRKLPRLGTAAELAGYGFRAPRGASGLRGHLHRARPQEADSSGLGIAWKPSATRLQPASHRSQGTDDFDNVTMGPGRPTHQERHQPTHRTSPSCLLCIWFLLGNACQELPGLCFFYLMVKILRSIMLCFAWQCLRTYL